MKSELLRNLLRLFLPGVAMLLALNASGQTIIQIASDGGASFFVKSDGSLWRGDMAHRVAQYRELLNRAYQEHKDHLPASQTEAQLREFESHMDSSNFEPVDLIASNGVTEVAMNGQRDTYFVKNDGSLWAMGNNLTGNLGDGTRNTPTHPVQIVTSGVVAVACGEDFTIFLKDDGSVWGFGWNGNGPLGDGSENESVMRPKRIIDGGVTAIAAGHYHSLLLKNDGSLWGTGGNLYGQLGLGKSVNHTLVPIEIVSSNVVSVAAANGHSLFIKSDGSLWAMGLNQWGQIGDCTIDWAYTPKQIVSNNVVALAAGESGSLFLKKDGSLWGMGINWGSDYGVGIEFKSRCPTQIFAPNNSALVAGYYYNTQLKTCVSVWAGKFNSATGTSAAKIKSGIQSGAASFPGYSLITVELLENGDVRLSYSGSAGLNYALERSSSLANPNWVSLVTNTAPSGGMLVITNKPDTSMNNFWRIRAVK
jgi:hypothetical protein